MERGGTEMKQILWILCLVLLALAEPAAADDQHYQDFIVGD